MKSQDFAKIMAGKMRGSKPLPDAPGVYFFKAGKGTKIGAGGGKDILYIGRATSLRDRVRSYFADDLIKTRGPLLVDMVTRATALHFQKTDSVLEAIILEANLIKKHQPYYNTKEKDNRSYNYVVITDEEFPRVMLVRERVLDMAATTMAAVTVDVGIDRLPIKKKFGPYPQGGLLKEALVLIRKIFPFRDAKASQKASQAHHEAFYRSIGLSPDTSTPEAKQEYAKTIRNLTLFFEGKKKALIKAMEKDMKMYAKTRQFEKAGMVKKTLYALGHIQDVALIKADATGGEAYGRPADTFRIEAYDIAHLGGGDVVGVMTVIEDGQANKSQYRKFKLSREVNDDVGNLKEILRRRFNHPEWPMPHLIVIDGGQAQKAAAEAVVSEVLSATSGDQSSHSIPIVSVVKDEHHKPRAILTNTADTAFNTTLSQRMDHDRTLEKAILLANNEAHRFAISYHRLRRGKRMLPLI